MIRKIVLAMAASAAFFIALVGGDHGLAPIATAEAKTACVVRGIDGYAIAPMKEIQAGLRAKGFKVKVSEFNQGVPQGCDVAVVHSAGDWPGLMSRAKKVITIDPTWLNPGCQPGSRCTNYYNALDAFPLIVCCGGYQVRGAKNIIAPAGHVQMPGRIWKQVVAEALN